jgi:hypothetical protein
VEKLGPYEPGENSMTAAIFIVIVAKIDLSFLSDI